MKIQFFEEKLCLQLSPTTKLIYNAKRLSVNPYKKNSDDKLSVYTCTCAVNGHVTKQTHFFASNSDDLVKTRTKRRNTNSLGKITYNISGI